MASRANRWSDGLEGKFSERHLKRRSRSDRRKRDASFEPLNSAQKRRKRSRRLFDDDRPARSIPRDWRDVSPDEGSEDEGVYGLDSDDNLDPDFGISIDDQDLDGSEIDLWPDDWR